MKILLDTCTIIWAISEPEKLSNQTSEILAHENSEIFVSPISCAEIACASQKGKIKINRHWKKWFRYYIEINGWTCIDISLPIIEESYSLPEPFHRDPADRIIVASSRLSSCTLLTADKKILNYPHVDAIW